MRLFHKGFIYKHVVAYSCKQRPGKVAEGRATDQQQLQQFPNDVARMLQSEYTDWLGRLRPAAETFSSPRSLFISRRSINNLVCEKNINKNK